MSSLRLANPEDYLIHKTSDGIEFAANPLAKPWLTTILTNVELSELYSNNFSTFSHVKFRELLKKTFPKEKWDELKNLDWRIDRKNGYLIEDKLNLRQSYSPPLSEEYAKLEWITNQGIGTVVKRENKRSEYSDYRVIVCAYPRHCSKPLEYTGPNVILLDGWVDAYDDDLKILKPFEIKYRGKPPQELKEFYVVPNIDGVGDVYGVYVLPGLPSKVKQVYELIKSKK